MKKYLMISGWICLSLLGCSNQVLQATNATDSTQQQIDLNQITTTTYTIQQAGTYTLQGKYEGQIIIDAGNQDVQLNLNGVQIYSPVGNCIYVKNAKSVVINTIDQTNNTLQDQKQDTDEESLQATIYSTSDLWIQGNGELTINANQNNAIQAKENLYFQQATINLTSADDGIVVNQELQIDQSILTLQVQGDGIKTTNQEAGNATITNSTLAIDAGDDGIQVIKDLSLNENVMTMDTVGKGITSDQGLTIEQTQLTISQSKEGLEAKNLHILSGTLEIHASDDGINATDGSQTQMMQADESLLTIDGGTITIYADGDGIDLNGSGVMNDGQITIYGPSDNGNGALDYNGTFQVNKGTLMAAGASGMAKSISDQSSQNAFMIQASGKTVTILDENDHELMSYTSSKTYDNVVLSSQDLTTGKIVKVMVDDQLLDTITIQQGTTMVGVSIPATGQPNQNDRPMMKPDMSKSFENDGQTGATKQKS